MQYSSAPSITLVVEQQFMYNKVWLGIDNIESEDVVKAGVAGYQS